MAINEENFIWNEVICWTVPDFRLHNSDPNIALHYKRGIYIWKTWMFVYCFWDTSSYLAVLEGNVPLGKVMTLFLTSSKERGTVKSTAATLEHINVSQIRAVISQSCHHLVLLSEFMWKTPHLLIVCAYLIGDNKL